MRLLASLARTVALILLVAAGTLALMRYAPGYFDDAREMDAEHAAGVRAEMDVRSVADRSAASMARTIAVGWLHGELGVSRHYLVPVGELIRPRLAVTLRLLVESLLLGWLTAFALALALSARRGRSGDTWGFESWLAVGSALLLSIPIGALATICLLTDKGGPVLAMGLLLAARDFKFLYRLLRPQWQAPHLLFARAQGTPVRQLIVTHLLRPILPQLASIMTMSFVLALSMAVPVEVVFDLLGIGQLAWTAAINRDLPLLLAVTLLMAAAVGVAGLFGEPMRAAGLSAEEV